MPQILRKTFSDFKERGAITPSSKKLAEKIVKTADVKNRKVIVDLALDLVCLQRRYYA
jgi:phospholipid N-methyltransferase